MLCVQVYCDMKKNIHQNIDPALIVDGYHAAYKQVLPCVETAPCVRVAHGAWGTWHMPRREPLLRSGRGVVSAPLGSDPHDPRADGHREMTIRRHAPKGGG